MAKEGFEIGAGPYTKFVDTPIVPPRGIGGGSIEVSGTRESGAKAVNQRAIGQKEPAAPAGKISGVINTQSSTKFAKDGTTGTRGKRG